MVFKNKMYIFGGHNHQNKRMSDMWAYDLINMIWEEVADNSLFKILPRSGHTAAVYQNYMIVFGGMLSVTKEVDDTCAFNFLTKEWV